MTKQIRLALKLIAIDLKILKKDLWGNLIDVMVWPTVASIVFGYILPTVGNFNKNYGAFVLMGAIITIGTVVAFDCATQIVVDFDNKRTIDYYLTLPINSYLLFVKQALSISLKVLLFTLPNFIWGKIVLYDRFDLTNLSIIKFLLIYSSITLFLGFFALWLASWVKNQSAFIHVWLRLYNPMIWFGGQVFSWEQLNRVFPKISYLMVINPITYCTEGLRSAIFGQFGFLNFWFCLFALLVQTLLFAIVSLRWLKKRLDCV